MVVYQFGKVSSSAVFKKKNVKKKLKKKNVFEKWHQKTGSFAELNLKTLEWEKSNWLKGFKCYQSIWRVTNCILRRQREMRSRNAVNLHPALECRIVWPIMALDPVLVVFSHSLVGESAITVQKYSSISTLPSSGGAVTVWCLLVWAVSHPQPGRSAWPGRAGGHPAHASSLAASWTPRHSNLPASDWWASLTLRCDWRMKWVIDRLD